MLIKHNSTVRVRYAETDQMGVMYHGNYAQYFEIGRTEWLRSLGVTYKYMEKTGIILPVISLNCNFKKSAYYDDDLSITTILKKRPSVKIEFEYEIHNQHNELICTGNTTLAFLNQKTMRPTRCPEYILEKLNTSVL
ncbi:acyl-CoA thioesterase [Tenacibaculum amylolyticum]|uniref:acyl-CoA thioesterase n=1 Tax=Tenacibaculum amylolyticum TaxID=104269 RepID=UPI003893B9EB